MCFDNNNHRNVIIFGSTKYSASKANDACLIIQPEIMQNYNLHLLLLVCLCFRNFTAGKNDVMLFLLSLNSVKFLSTPLK